MQIWKQKGEEYRLTAYSGWAWLSYTRRKPADSNPHLPASPLSDQRRATLDSFLNSVPVLRCRDAATDTAVDATTSTIGCQVPERPAYDHRFLETDVSMSDERFAEFVDAGLFAECRGYDIDASVVETPPPPVGTIRRSVSTSTGPPFVEFAEHHVEAAAEAALEPRVRRTANPKGLKSRSRKVKWAVTRDQGVTCTSATTIDAPSTITDVDGCDFRVKYLPLEVHLPAFAAKAFRDVGVNSTLVRRTDSSVGYDENDFLNPVPSPKMEPEAKSATDCSTSAGDGDASLKDKQDEKDVDMKPVDESNDETSVGNQGLKCEGHDIKKDTTNSEFKKEIADFECKKEIEDSEFKTEIMDNKLIFNIKKEKQVDVKLESKCTDVPENWKKVQIKKEINLDENMDSKIPDTSMLMQTCVTMKREPDDSSTDVIATPQSPLYRFRQTVRLIPEVEQTFEAESFPCDIAKRCELRRVVNSSSDGLHSLLVARLQQEVAELRNKAVVKAAVDRMRAQVFSRSQAGRHRALVDVGVAATGRSVEVVEAAVARKRNPTSPQTAGNGVTAAVTSAGVAAVTRHTPAYDHSVQRLVYGGKIHLSAGVLDEVDRMLLRHASLGRLCSVQRFVAPVKRSAAARRRYRRRLTTWSGEAAPLPPLFTFRRRRSRDGFERSLFVQREDVVAKMIRSAGRTEIAFGFNYNCKVSGMGLRYSIFADIAVFISQYCILSIRCKI